MARWPCRDGASVNAWKRVVVAAALAGAATPASAHDHADGNFVVFTSGADEHTDSAEDAWAVADIVFSLSRSRLRLFGELNASSSESDLERFEVGSEPAADTVIWFGRFHQPSSAWNSKHHHGRYLQTSITLPSCLSTSVAGASGSAARLA